MLTHLIKTHNWYQVLVFTRTKHGADRLVKQLHQDEIVAMAIHGNKSQAARTRALGKFKDGSLQVLVATDIAARGLDISELPHVVNYELPNVPEDYVHRIGRTGRAGSSGEAISLVCVDERKFLSDIEKLIKRSLPQEIIDGFDPDPRARPEPIQVGRQQKHQPRRGGHSDRNAIAKPSSQTPSKSPAKPQQKNQSSRSTPKSTAQPIRVERGDSNHNRDR